MDRHAGAWLCSGGDGGGRSVIGARRVPPGRGASDDLALLVPMSQHILNTVYDGRSVRVMLGWDQPLQYFFLIVEALDEEWVEGDESCGMKKKIFPRE